MVRDEETNRKRMSGNRDGGSERCPAALSVGLPALVITSLGQRSW